MKLPVKLLKIAKKVITKNFAPSLELLHIQWSKVVFSNAFILVEFHPVDTNDIDVLWSINLYSIWCLSNSSRDSIILRWINNSLLEFATWYWSVYIQDQNTRFVNYNFDDLISKDKEVKWLSANNNVKVFFDICNSINTNKDITDHWWIMSFEYKDSMWDYRIICRK